MAARGEKPTTQQLEAMRLLYAQNGRNAHKVAEAFGFSGNSACKYRDANQWDKWADEYDRRVSESTLSAAVKDEVRSRVKRLSAAVKIAEKCLEGAESARVHGTGIDKLATALERSNKVIELLTGGATERPDLGGMSDDELRERLRRIKDRHGIE